jgi:FG-GAP-like repeat/FG-GAP repeat
MGADESSVMSSPPASTPARSLDLQSGMAGLWGQQTGEAMEGSRSKLVALSGNALRLAMAGLLLAATVGLDVGDASAASQPLEPSFVEAFNFVGMGGSNVATGDVDGDGDLDLVATNQFPPSISLLVGNGDGTFASHVDYAVPAAGGVRLVDLNGDGFDDVVVASGSAGLTVLMANGDGTLADGVGYAPGLSPTGWGMGDVNGDGHVDVVVSTSSGVSVLAGNGDGTLAAPTSVYASADVDDMALADVNGDTILDLLAAETPQTSSSVVRVLFGDGQGGFSSHGLMVFSGGATLLGPLVTADLNGDGHLDVIVSDFVGGPVAVFLGNGDGSFGPILQFGGGQTPRSIAAGDLNRDGIADLAIVDALSFTRLFLGRGDGTFALSAFVVGSPSIAVTMGDFNADSALDFAVATRQDTQLHIPDDVTVLLNTTCRTRPHSKKPLPPSAKRQCRAPRRQMDAY